MAAAYQMTDGDAMIRTADGAHIPRDPANLDWSIYARWRAAGNLPDPAPRPSLASHTASAINESARSLAIAQSKALIAAGDLAGALSVLLPLIEDKAT